MILRSRDNKRRRSQSRSSGDASNRDEEDNYEGSERGSVNIEDNIEETYSFQGSPEVDESAPVPDSAQATKAPRRGPGVRSPRKEQPNECTSPGCMAPLTPEDKERKLVNCETHRDIHNRAKRTSNSNKKKKLSSDSATSVPSRAVAGSSISKKKKLLSMGSTTVVSPDALNENLDRFTEDIANSIAAHLFRNNSLNLHKEIFVESKDATVNSQGSAFVQKLGLKLAKWASATIMRQVIQYLHTHFELTTK
ncbi:hypothetical protein HWV62_20860 [Athelia sp. TMB]|nr:hypothetical protein HWV62_20860 [Athelia sp. TMB]